MPRLTLTDEAASIRMARALQSLTEHQLPSNWCRLRAYMRAGLTDKEIRPILDECALRHEQERRGKILVTTPLAKED